MMKLIALVIFSVTVFADTPPPPNTFLRSYTGTPSNPSSGTYKFYVKTSDGLAYTRNSSGTETLVGSSTSPGGSTTQVQFNNAGSFGGSANLVWNGTNLLMNNAPAGGILSIRSNAMDQIYIQKTSGFQSYIFGIDSSSNLIIYDALNGRSAIKIASGAANDSIYIHDSSTGFVDINSSLDMKSHAISNVTDPSSAQQAATKNYVDTFVGPYLGGAGSLTNATHSFSADPNSGLYEVAANNPALAVDGAQAFNCKKSSGGFGNCGFGGASSTSDNYPLIMQRSVNGGGVFLAVENTNTGTNSKSCVSLPADNNNLSAELCAGATGSVDILDKALRIRVTGTGKGIFYDAGDQSTGFHEFRVGGDPLSTGTAVKINSNKSTTFYGAPIVQVQGAGVTPTCDTARLGGLAVTSGFILCVCNGSGTTWKKVSDGTTTCTF